MNVNCVPAETEATRAYTRENFTLQLEEVKLMSGRVTRCPIISDVGGVNVGTTQNLHHTLERWV